MKKPHTADTKDAALYVRVSTADQGERFSLTSQLKALRSKAEREGYRVREDWIFKDAHSGKLESRPEFDKLKALVRTGAPGAVFIFDVSRFARRVLDALKLAAEFKRYEVKLDFVETPYQDSAAGRFTFTQMAAVAEFMGEKIIEDSKRGSRQKLEQGGLTHGAAPYGYVYIDKRQPNGSRFEIDTADSSVPGLSRVQVVRDIYNWRRSGMPTYRIAKRLHEMGVKTAGNRGPRLWSRQAVLKILGNSTYIGKHIRSGIVVPCPAIIDEQLWNEIQRMNQETREKHTGRPSKNKYLLRSLLYCGKCGKRYISTPSKGNFFYYRCGTLTRIYYARQCDAPQVAGPAVEKAVWSAIWQLLKDPALLLRLGRAYYEALETPEGDSTGTLQHEHERLTRKIETTRAMIQDNLIPYAQGKADIRECEERIRRIAHELAAAGRVVSLPPLQVAQAAVREIVTGPEPTTYEGRRSILEGILDLRLTYHNRDLTIEGKIPVPVPAASGGQKKCHMGIGPVSFQLLFGNGVFGCCFHMNAPL
jgi:site-specific DNA recombinase